jgi:hypothetical protein
LINKYAAIIESKNELEKKKRSKKGQESILHFDYLRNQLGGGVAVG